MVSTIKFSQFAQSNLSNTTNSIVGVSAASGGINFKQSNPLSWTTANRPASPATGLLGYNTNLGQYEYWNGVAWVQLSSGGSGTVNVGSANQIAYYPANGASVSGLLGANNAVLTTTALGAPLWSTTLPASLTIPQPIIQGVTNGSSAGSGVVGEVISSQVLIGSQVSFSSLTPGNITQISLSPGDYDVWGSVFFNTSTGGAGFAAWISNVSATVPDLSLIAGQAGATFGNYGTPVPSKIFNVSSTTTIYLSAQVQFSSGTAACSGGIFARRRR